MAAARQPRTPFPQGGEDCRVCSKRVFYNASRDPTAKDSEFGKYRRSCLSCKKWVHYWCFSHSEGLCLDCSGPSPEAMRNAAKTLGLSSEEEQDSAVLIMSSFAVGPDEEALAKFTGLSPDFIRPRAERMRQSGIWTEDGTVIIDEDVDMEDGRQSEIVVILHTLCALGIVTCSRDADDKIVMSVEEKENG